MVKITGEITISPLRFAEIKKRVRNIPEFKKEVERFSAQKITQFIETILGGAVVMRASDLHIEPEEKQVRIRARIDGVLQDVAPINRTSYEFLLSRLKLLAGLKLNIADRSQDGRFSIVVPPEQKKKKITIEVRASSLPAEHGETIVLRILNPQNLIEIKDLGLRKDLLEIFKKEIKKPNGMVLVTGPTGSGKTTTLYAFLKELQRPEIKIITIEDPIEYHLDGASQTQVRPEKGYDFAQGLKSIVRQDPDVILVGEVRDAQTAKIALQAALTGHLVFSTLHTNDAAGTIARLTNFGANPSDIGPALNAAIAQRLVRKVCPKCRKLVKISKENLGKIKKELAGLPKKVKTPKLLPSLKIPQVVGCKDCNFTGYRGRIGLFEAFPVDEDMEKLILKNPSMGELRRAAIKKGMVLMRQDGFIKILEGLTTIEEVERTTSPK